MEINNILTKVLAQRCEDPSDDCPFKNKNEDLDSVSGMLDKTDTQKFDILFYHVLRCPKRSRYLNVGDLC
jgi:hypothetical protein